MKVTDDPSDEWKHPATSITKYTASETLCDSETVWDTESGRTKQKNHRTGEEMPFTIASEINSNGMMLVLVCLLLRAGEPLARFALVK